jgi:hypothetical protein
VLRPGERDLPPVQALLTIVASVQTALGGDALGEIDGTLVTAEMARELARAFAGQPQPAPAADVGTAHPGGQSRADRRAGWSRRSPRLGRGLRGLKWTAARAVSRIAPLTGGWTWDGSRTCAVQLLLERYNRL